MNIYIANLSLETTGEDLRNLFVLYGTVKSAKVITNGTTHLSKGFGFVEIESESDALRAIKRLHRSEFQGNKIVVKKAESTKQVNRNENI